MAGRIPEDRAGKRGRNAERTFSIRIVGVPHGARRVRSQATKLDWVAVDHFNTGHSHTHIVIRGCDDRGGKLVIGGDNEAELVRVALRAIEERGAIRGFSYGIIDPPLLAFAGHAVADNVREVRARRAEIAAATMRV
jgi:hypothetical protein